ncbi:MAG: hypothetical protein ACK4YP_21595 [Myxococcota bacterium]
MIVPVHKPPGWTPLEALEDLRARTPALADVPMVYAGRLDPMAEGVLLVLAGDDRHALPAHLVHDKDYVATLLFGVRSDTHDALGRLAVGAVPALGACRDAVAALRGANALPLPAWSAYRVKGRPLHAWAREGRLHEIVVPTRDMTVTRITDTTARPVRAADLLDDVRARITRVRGDFRQADALADWAALAATDPPLVAVTTTLTVTSGTYVRALAHALGERLGCGALLLALRRTRVGPFIG